MMSTSKFDSCLDRLSSIDKEGVEVAKQPIDPDAEFGGLEARRRLERKLLWKLDLRMSVLVFIYILNYVSNHYAKSR